MSPDGWEDVRRVLVVRLDNVGDVVMTGPALRTLHAALPHASVTLLASPAGAQISPLLPWIDDLLVHRAAWQDVSGEFAQQTDADEALVATLRVHAFDAAFILTSFAQSPWPPAQVCWRAGIPRRIGQSKEWGGSLLTTLVPPPSDAGHQVDRNLHLLEACGFPVIDRRLALRVPPMTSEATELALTALGVDTALPFLAVAPFASCPARTYDTARFAEAVRGIQEATGMHAVVLGGQRDHAAAGAFVEAVGTGRVASLAGRLELAEQAAAIARASLVVTNDSGPMHLADAFGRPVVVLFAGTELASQWQPRTSPSAVLTRQVDCSPCYAFECPVGGTCLDIPAAEVTAHALRLLEQPQGAGRREGARACAS